MRISTEDIRDEDWLKVAKSLFSSVSPHIGYGRPHTCAKPTTLSLRCPRTSVPAQRSPREVCATAAPDQRYGDPGAWFVSGARREVQPVAGISVVHPAWQCATHPLQHVRRGGGVLRTPAFVRCRLLRHVRYTAERIRWNPLGHILCASAMAKLFNAARRVIKSFREIDAAPELQFGRKLAGMRDILKLLEFARICTEQSAKS